jgi:hypothetical protein
MKNFKKLSIAIVVTFFSTILFSNCSDDIIDETISSPGYFVIDGVKHPLHKSVAFYDEGGTCPYSDVQFVSNAVLFTSSGLTVESWDSGSGSGDIVMIQCMDPQKQKFPGTGDYLFQMDSKAVKPFTYFDFEIIQNMNAENVESPNNGIIYSQVKVPVKVKKDGDVYEYSSSGNTEDGKPFEFYYKGEIIANPM